MHVPTLIQMQRDAAGSRRYNSGIEVPANSLDWARCTGDTAFSVRSPYPMRSVFLALSLAVVPSLAFGAPITADLCGYGRIGFVVERAASGDGVAIFTCASRELADQLLSKLRADFAWDKLCGPREIRLPGGVPALMLNGGAVLVFARKGSSVYAVAASSPGGAQSILAARALTGPGVAFAAKRRHPASLDFFDLQPISMYFLPMNVRDMANGWRRYDHDILDRLYDFWSQRHIGFAQFTPYFVFDELADGATHLFPMEYCIRTATERNMPVMEHFGFYGAPWWIRNRFPRDIVGWDPYCISGWNPDGAMAGAYLSQFASDDAYSYARRFEGRALDALRKTAGAKLACIRVVGGGHPGDEMGLHHMSTEFMDYDPAGQAAFRKWLRDTRHLDLAALGRRWYGDPKHFRSWDAVMIPSQFEFFGGFGHGTLNLLTGWMWRQDSPTAEREGWYKTAYVPDDNWTPTDLAPSMKQLFLFGSSGDKKLRQGNSTVAWMRKEFDPTSWLAANTGKQFYLVAYVNDMASLPVDVWLNDAYLGALRPKDVWCGPIAFKATALVHPGRNVLTLKVRSGLIRGPVFLTTEEPRRYPYLGRHANARFVDLRDWSAQKLILGWRRDAAFARSSDPDTPFMFCPGACKEFWDQFLGLKRGLGISCLHFTGGGSSYMPWWAGLGYVIGTYSTSEEGGTIFDPFALSRELAWMLLDAHGHHNYYYDALDCMRIEEKTGWFTKNARLFDIYGKANWVQPPIAILRAAKSDLYFPYTAYADDWDIGRSSLQSSHFQNVYVTEAEVKAGLASVYPVLWDAGTQVMDDALVAALERYVRAGGTYVAVNVTGRHTPLDADAWPIEKLTGFKVVGARENMQVTILPGNPLFKRLAGMTFNGNGIALNWMGVNHLAEGSVALEPKEHDSVVLARWKDGTVAVGMRRLGKGRVIILGSSFWRNMSDSAGNGVSFNGSIQTAFFNDLFAGLGLKHQVDMDSEDVWTRRLITKNGLQDWVMIWNAGSREAKNLTLTFPLAIKPARVLDLTTGKAVPFAWADGEVRVPVASLPANGFGAYAVDRRDLLDAVQHWFAEKRKYATRVVVPKPKAPPLPPPAAVVMDTWRFRQADARAKNDLSWLTEPTTTTAWKNAGYGFWDEMGYAAKGIGLYRCTFRVPTNWSGHRVMLCFASFDYPVFLEKATVYLNGRRVGDYNGHSWANFDVLDVTAAIRPGENTLGVLVEATEGRGGYIGQMVAFTLENLANCIDLGSGWKLFSDNRRFTRVDVPIDAEGRHLETQVHVPASWKNRDVFLEFEVANKWVYEVVVNGRAIGYNLFLHPFGDIMQVNLYPWIRPGETNTIELWGRSPGDIATQRMVVKSVRLGTVTRL